jgi:hypothetical protein
LSPIQLANGVVAFLVELGLLVAVGYASFQLPGQQWWRTLLAAVIPLLVLLIWAEYAAPKAAHRLKMPWLLLFKAVLFGVGVAALYWAGQPKWAIVFGVVAATHLAIATATGNV